MKRVIGLVLLLVFGHLVVWAAPPSVPTKRVQADWGPDAGSLHKYLRVNETGYLLPTSLHEGAECQTASKVMEIQSGQLVL